MKLEKYIPDSQMIREAVDAERLHASRGLLTATRIMRDELRKLVEEHPSRDENDLTKDLYFRLGMIHMANWVLRLPVEAKAFLERSPSDPVPE